MGKPAQTLAASLLALAVGGCSSNQPARQQEQGGVAAQQASSATARLSPGLYEGTSNGLHHADLRLVRSGAKLKLRQLNLYTDCGLSVMRNLPLRQGRLTGLARGEAGVLRVSGRLTAKRGWSGKAVAQSGPCRGQSFELKLEAVKSYRYTDLTGQADGLTLRLRHDRSNSRVKLLAARYRSCDTQGEGGALGASEWVKLDESAEPDFALSHPDYRLEGGLEGGRFIGQQCAPLQWSRPSSNR